LGNHAWLGEEVFILNLAPITIDSHAVLTAGSVATSDLQPFGIYRGNSEVLIKQRVIAKQEN